MEVLSIWIGVKNPKFGLEIVMFDITRIDMYYSIHIFCHPQCDSLNISYKRTHFALAALHHQTLIFVLGFLFTKCHFSGFYSFVLSWSAFLYIQTSAPNTNQPLQNTWQIYTDCVNAWNYLWDMHILVIHFAVYAASVYFLDGCFWCW